MSILFEAYELLAKSGLFDPDFYFRANPEVAALNLDPLMHYLERGGRERRDPSADFDTSYYLRQCEESGEQPENALLHFLTVGESRGLHSRPHAANAAMRESSTTGPRGPTGHVPPERRFYIDVPRITNGAAEAIVHGGLSIAGWALSPEGIDRVEVALDGRRVAVAYYGIRRPDVASAHPKWIGALQCGFAAHVPPRALSAGRHAVTLTARDRAGGVVKREFTIEAEGLSDDHGAWSLRRNMTRREVDVQLAVLKRQRWRPLFEIIMPLSGNARNEPGARRTLASLGRQTYPDWRIRLVPPKEMAEYGRSTRRLLSRFVDGFEDLAARIRVANASSGETGSKHRHYVFSVAPGDEFGCDALLEFALSCGIDRDADLIYCDERRMNPADRQVGAFFKPQWSPDLLLSTNYIGRSWCVSSELLDRSELSMRDLAARSDYEIALRLTEVARRIRHLPKLLFKRTEDRVDGKEAEKRALAGAMKRRQIAGEIRTGSTAHYYRVKRTCPKRELVSIIVPTCAAGGLIQTCIETLRARTAYRRYEVICIENIPKDRSPWRKWLRKNADLAITIDEAFNWSRYNNRAAARANGAHLLFLNDDIEIIEPDWLDALLEHSQRPEVGVVGPQLLYPDRSVQHAGMALDSVGRGRHIFRHLRQDELGYFGMALTQRNVIGLTGACLMTRRDTFERLGQFETAHAVINGDLDYCLRSWSGGLLNIYTPHARLVHHELASRGQLAEQYDSRAFMRRWRGTITRGDPYFNPNLSLDNDQVEIEREPVQEVFAGPPLFARDSVRKILVVKLDHIGDSITALTPVRRLKRAFVDAKISVLAGRATQAIWKSEPCVEETLEFNLFHERSGLGAIEISERDISALGESLAYKRFDLAIDLRKQPDTRHVLQHSGARILAGFDHHGRFPWLDVAIEWDEDVPLRSKRAHVSEDLNMLIDALAARSEPAVPVTAAPASHLKLPSELARRLFSRPLVCVHAASGSEMRQWPLPKFAELIDLLLADDCLNVAIIGGSDETEVAESVLRLTTRPKRVLNLVGKLGLSELPKLLARAALFVGNNSGPQHLAASLGVPTVGIHSGVVDAHEWGPVGARAMAIRRQMSCSPCFIEKAKDCPRALACLTGLDAREVFSRCQRMLLLSD